MNRNEQLNDYAELLVQRGIRVQKGEELWIFASLDQPDFVTTVVEKAYKAGAKRVQVQWDHNPVDKLGYKYQTVGELAKVRSFQLAKYKYMAKKFPSMLYIISDDPDAMKGINPMKVAKARMKSYPKIKPYRDQMDGNQKWCIAGVPGKKWAHKVFPNIKDETEAVEKLWDAILTTARVDENGGVKNWDDHNNFLKTQKEKMNNFKFKYLEYKASNGTNFKVELLDGINWGAGEEVDSFGRKFNPNIPSEEVFTSPKAGSCEGTLVASLPLSYQGQLIEDFSITFKDGKVSEVHAKKNQAVLEQMVKMDPGASMLGEVALVPFSSPINRTSILFFDTLYDENAVCHVALGAGFKDLFPDAAEITTEEATKRGINDSMIHVDFMVGTKDLSIVGIDHSGKRVQVFKDGEWAI